jgi:2-oxoacid:acceptor oxidoreductase gamma subunit (pyruvate/2-ketoisovalerate family)
MIEIKISGRGGQGAVLASQILAAAMFETGLWVQSFPSFGAERRGAPVSAFLRADDEEITLRCGVQHPDWIVLFDPNLLANPMVTGGANDKTSIVLNSLQPTVEALPFQYQNFFQIDATAIAEDLNLKTTSFSIVNTAMVGAFAGASGLVEIKHLDKIIRDLVPIKKEENAAAAQKAYEYVQEFPHGR